MAYQSYRSQFGDTTFTKVFVGGLAWETPTEEMRRYFQQFGEILEAVIINDKNTGRSKGYGFVTFRDPESARRACVDPNPVIDGRRANCNIASLGRPRPSPPRGRNQGGTSYRGGPPSQLGSTSYNRVAPPLPPPPPPLPALPPPPVMYSPYGYATYTPDYGYQSSFYNPNLQPQYYYQAYGTSSMTPTISSPYSQASRGSFTVPPEHRLQPPSFLHYQPMPSLQGEGSFVTVAPPQPPPRQPVSLSIATSQTPRETSATITGVELTTSRSPDT